MEHLKFCLFSRTLGSYLGRGATWVVGIPYLCFGGTWVHVAIETNLPVFWLYLGTCYG